MGSVGGWRVMNTPSVGFLPFHVAFQGGDHGPRLTWPLLTWAMMRLGLPLLSSKKLM